MKKAFTLIELLAVIIILAIVALIATPLILDVIEDSRKSANMSSANLVLSSAKNFYAESLLDESKKTYLDGNTNLIDEISLSEKPENGIVYITNDGKIYVSMIYDNICYYKDYTDSNIKDTTDMSKCFIDESEPLIEAKVQVTKIENGTDSNIASLFEINQNGSSSITKTICINKTNNDEITNLRDLQAGTHEIECTVTKNNNKSAKSSTKVSVIDYGENISELYENIYAGTDTGKLVTGSNLYFSGNYRYASYIPGYKNTLINKQDIHKGPDGTTYKQNYIYSGQRYYEFSQPTSLNRWVKIMICGGYLTTGVQVGNLSLKFSDGNTYTIEQAINNKYIKPLVILSSPDSVEDGTGHGDHYFGNTYNLLNGGSTATANYPILFVFFKVSDVSQLEGINLYSNINFVTSYSDGLIVDETSEGFELSLYPW